MSALRLLPKSFALALPVAAGVWLAPAVSQAGIPECNGVRLEDAGHCEIRGELDCTAGCDEFGIYKKACATKLMNVCRNECVLDPNPQCEDECTVQCSADCDAGINVICQHNCFGECEGACDAQCAGAQDGAQCRASCEATCDGECDIQCEAVDGDCYYHCVECCGGSCTAQANMDCQEVCQDQEFETCELEFKADCMASCSGDGALFCDGEYVMSGPQIETCINALIDEGLGDLEGDLGIKTENGNPVFCSVTPNGTKEGAVLSLLGLIALIARRRR